MGTVGRPPVAWSACASVSSASGRMSGGGAARKSESQSGEPVGIMPCKAKADILRCRTRPCRRPSAPNTDVRRGPGLSNIPHPTFRRVAIVSPRRCRVRHTTRKFWLDRWGAGSATISTPWTHCRLRGAHSARKEVAGLLPLMGGLKPIRVLQSLRQSGIRCRQVRLSRQFASSVITFLLCAVGPVCCAWSLGGTTDTGSFGLGLRLMIQNLFVAELTLPGSGSPNVGTKGLCVGTLETAHRSPPSAHRASGFSDSNLVTRLFALSPPLEASPRATLRTAAGVSTRPGRARLRHGVTCYVAVGYGEKETYRRCARFVPRATKRRVFSSEAG